MIDTVAITGLGAVTGYGWGLGELWKGLMSGKSAAHRVAFDDFVGLAATVPGGGGDTTRLARSPRRDAATSTSGRSSRGRTTRASDPLTRAGEFDDAAPEYVMAPVRLPLVPWCRIVVRR